MKTKTLGSIYGRCKTPRGDMQKRESEVAGRSGARKSGAPKMF